MSKVHVLPDERLGGVLREYVEVDRKAEIGEKIIVTNAHMNGSYYDNGDIFTVIERYDYSTSERPNCVGVCVEEIDDVYGIRDYEYKTLEPTDIVHIDNKRYRLIDRKAKEGERVIIINSQAEGLDIGFIGTVFEVINDGDIVVINGCFGHYHGDYLVLESIEQQQFTDSQNKPDIPDKLANLARRVTELEKRVVAIDEHNDVLIDRINDVEGKLNQIKTPYFKTFAPNIYFNIHTKEKSAEELANEIIRKLHEMIGKYTQ
jgi:hypothetical protein